jgi:hypothetical protein
MLKMTNSWSLLYHTINGTLDEVFPVMGEKNEKDYVVGLSTESDSKWAEFDMSNVEISIDTSNYPKAEIEKPPVHYKYNEEKILEKIKDYIGRTYSSHYSYNDRVQTLDLIEAVGDASAFCRSNILKYASRYDKKGTTRLDIEKIIHYAVLLYHFEGLDKDSTNGYETF